MRPWRSPMRSRCSTSTRRARSRSASSPGSSGLSVARAAAERMGGGPVWWLPTPAQAREALAPRLRPGSGAGHDRRRGCLQARRGAARGRRRSRDERSRRACSADFSLARLTTVRTGGPRRLVRAARQRAELVELLALGRGGGAARRSDRLGIEPARSRRWIQGTCDQAGRGPRDGSKRDGTRG